MRLENYIIRHIVIGFFRKLPRPLLTYIYKVKNLFNCYTFGQVSGHIDIQAFLHCHMVCQHLHWDDT